MRNWKIKFHLVINNIQSELKPIEIGLNALKVVIKDSKNGLSAAAYGGRIGNIEERSIQRYLNAAEVFQYISKQSDTGVGLLQEVIKLNEIHKTDQSNWLFLHNFINERLKIYKFYF